MADQPNLFTPEPTDLAERAAPPSSRSQQRARQKYALWLERAELLVRVIVRLYLGLLIVALPWMRFWTENGLLNFNRTLSAITGSGFTRGLVSGLGALNVMMALQELFFPRTGR